MNPELKPTKFKKDEGKDEKKATTTTTKTKKTRESLHTTLKAVGNGVKKTKKVPRKRVIYESSDSKESVHEMDVQEDIAVSKEEKSQRYQVKIAQSQNDNSEDE